MKSFAAYINEMKFGKGVRETRKYKKVWTYEEFFHRDDGPAVEWNNGDEEYWVAGKRHRIDGPAVDFKSKDYTEYWIEGKRFKDEEDVKKDRRYKG